jgi:hypothetical protein
MLSYRGAQWAAPTGFEANMDCRADSTVTMRVATACGSRNPARNAKR